MSGMAGDEDSYWYDLRTGRVDRGHQRGARDLMGPYPSEAAARDALATARERTDAWDAADRED